MVSPKHRNTVLHVKAVGLVRHIDVETGRPQQNMRFVGRDANHNILPEGERISYHSFYIQQLKDRALEPMDLATRKAAGL